jgi:two-component system, LytTR family, response regulator
MSMRALIDHDRLESTPVEMTAHLQEVPRAIVVRCGGRATSIDLNAIEWIEAAANYIKIHAGEEQFVVRQKISTMEEELPKSKFVRIHRCLIVSLDQVRNLQACGNGEFVVVLNNSKELPLGRTYRAHVESAMKPKIVAVKSF